MKLARAPTFAPVPSGFDVKRFHSPMKAKKLIAHPGQRQASLNAHKTLKMARSAHSYVRGSTRNFYMWLESGAGRSVPEGPDIWISWGLSSRELRPCRRRKRPRENRDKGSRPNGRGKSRTRFDSAGPLARHRYPGLGLARRNNSADA